MFPAWTDDQPAAKSVAAGWSAGMDSMGLDDCEEEAGMDDPDLLTLHGWPECVEGD